MEYAIIQVTETGEEFCFEEAGPFELKHHAELYLEVYGDEMRQQYPESDFYIDSI